MFGEENDIDTSNKVNESKIGTENGNDIVQLNVDTYSEVIPAIGKDVDNSDFNTIDFDDWQKEINDKFTTYYNKTIAMMSAVTDTEKFSEIIADVELEKQSFLIFVADKLDKQYSDYVNTEKMRISQKFHELKMVISETKILAMVAKSEVRLLKNIIGAGAVLIAIIAMILGEVNIAKSINFGDSIDCVTIIKIIIVQATLLVPVVFIIILFRRINGKFVLLIKYKDKPIDSNDMKNKSDIKKK